LSLKIGVLALQGDFREHLQILSTIGVQGVPVRTNRDLDVVSGLIIPGGESTTIQKLAENFGLFEPIQAKIQAGLPVFGTCAGLIMIADRILGGIEGQIGFGGLDVTVQRNAFGHHSDSFEIDLDFAGIDGQVHAAFIRAPLITHIGEKAKSLAALPDGSVVAATQDNLLGISFHPEMTAEPRIHSLFVKMAKGA
jgi:5'-phosphate synthase pdxT subunit